MRLMWRYFAGGKEVSGNSAVDLENMVEDEVPVPSSGKFKVGLDLKRAEGGAVDVRVVGGEDDGEAEREGRRRTG